MGRQRHPVSRDAGPARHFADVCMIEGIPALAYDPAVIAGAGLGNVARLAPLLPDDR
jgi:hypothetical protein